MNPAYDAGRGHFIPAYMMPALRRYIDEGILPGDFLRAVLCNDLREAVSKADETNLPNLRAYCVYLYNEAPGACYGSPQKVAAWAKAKQREGAAA